MAQVTGTCIVRKNGRTLFFATGATMDLGGFERTAELADHSVIGYSQKPMEATVSGTAKHTASTSLQDIMDTVNATISFETDTGSRYTLRGAWCTKPPVLTSGNGEVAVEFKGQPALEETGA
jgi:hypothetical protein